MTADESGLSRSEIANLIDEWIFNERDRNVLRRRLFDAVTYEELADEFHLSPRHVKRIVYKGKERIFSHMKLS